MAFKKSSEKGSKKSSTQNGGKPVLVAQVSSMSAQSNRSAAGVEQEIRRRAYELYEARGRQDGLDRDDWVQAEAEILSRRKESA